MMHGGDITVITNEKKINVTLHLSFLKGKIQWRDWFFCLFVLLLLLILTDVLPSHVFITENQRQPYLLLVYPVFLKLQTSHKATGEATSIISFRFHQRCNMYDMCTAVLRGYCTHATQHQLQSVSSTSIDYDLKWLAREREREREREKSFFFFPFFP